MNKTLVFDMDGTIADLYGVKNWLSAIRSGSVQPYKVARPLYDMEVVNGLLHLLKQSGWEIVVVSWSAMGATRAYNNEVRKAKVEWLDRMDFPYDKVHVVKYGTTKANCTRKIGGYQILVDDNADIRKGWNLGGTINPTKNLINSLLELI